MAQRPSGNRTVSRLVAQIQCSNQAASADLSTTHGGGFTLSVFIAKRQAWKL